jgi:P27 family predicted phage terminase small subunit
VKGRKPKPTFLKLIEGNPGHRPINRDEPEPEGELKDPPEHFSSRQQRIWRECIENSPQGLLSKLDGSMLEIFVVAKSGWEAAIARVEESGAVVRIPGGQWAQNPFVSIARRHAETMVKVGSELGFSPASRSRVKISGKKKTKSALGKLRELKLD